jgi:uncharacterized membrane protein YkvA (DUF1232 family)
MTDWVNRWKQSARRLKRETLALYLAYQDPRTPWYAKALATVVVGYAFSPLDLIPDPIPVLGYLDDLILVPLGIAITLRMIPPAVMMECRRQAEERMTDERPRNWVAAAAIVGIWLLSAALVIKLVIQVLSR